MPRGESGESKGAVLVDPSSVRPQRGSVDPEGRCRIVEPRTQALRRYLFIKEYRPYDRTSSRLKSLKDNPQIGPSRTECDD